MEKKLDIDEVIVEIPSGEQKSKTGEMEASKSNNIQVDQEDLQGLRSRKKGPVYLSTEIPKKNNGVISTSQQVDDPEKPKSRFAEQEKPKSVDDWKIGSNNDQVTTTTSPKVTPPVTPPRTPTMASPTYDDVDAGIYHKERRKKNKLLFVIEVSLFVCITLVLILSTTINKLKDKEIWSLELWKWCGLGLTIICGHLFSEWLMNTLVFLIEKNLLLRKTTGYYFYAAQKSFRIFIWLGLILVAWVFLIIRGANRSNDTDKVLNYITRGIASTLVIAGAWILRTILVKFLYASFYEKRFFERIQENIFHQYILKTLSGKPVMELSEMIDSSRSLTKQVSVKSSSAIDVQKLRRMKPGQVSAWTMTRLIGIASQSGFYTYSNTNDKLDLTEWDGENRNITNEWEAIAAAKFIFINVAKPGRSYIEEEDLLRFMMSEEADVVLSSVGGGGVESGKIDKKSFSNWVVSIYMKNKFLEHSLNDINGAIKQLNKFVTGLLVVALMIFWVILMGIVKTEVLLFISSQFLLAVFTFGSSAKSTFEAMIFVFVKHPFDVGDRCVIDGVQVVVEEVSILTTIFLRHDNEKIYYPNSELATKSISNFNRSPEMMETVEFNLDGNTSVEKISHLKVKIKKYIEHMPHLWRPKHSIRVREIQGLDKMTLRLYVTHTINFQDYGEKSERRSDLMLELKHIFDDLGLKYHILPPTSSD